MNQIARDFAKVLQEIAELPDAEFDKFTDAFFAYVEELKANDELDDFQIVF